MSKLGKKLEWHLDSYTNLMKNNDFEFKLS